MGVIRMQIFMKIIMLIISIIYLILIFKTKEKYKLIINRYFWLFGSWIVCLLLYFFSGIKYTFNLTIISFGFIFLSLFLFVIGNYISKKINLKFVDNIKINGDNKKINFLPLFLVSLFFTIFYVIYIFINNNIIFGVTRDIKTNFLTTIFLFISSSSLIIWLYELSYSLINNKKISWYALVSAILFNIPGLVISGRDALMIFLITTFIIFIYCGNYAIKELKKPSLMYKKILKYSIVVLFVILIYLIFLSSNRYGKDENAPLNMFEYSAGCKFPHYLKKISEVSPSVGNFTNNIVFYYSSQISKYAFVFDNYNGPYLYGFYQLHYISRRFPENSKLRYNLVGNELKRLTTNYKIPALKVLWETALGYSIYDFGRIGTLVASVIGGTITGLISRIIYKKNAIFSTLINTFICLAMFMTVEFSPLFDYFYIFPLIWLIIIIFIIHRKNRDKKALKLKNNSIKK